MVTSILQRQGNIATRSNSRSIILYSFIFVYRQHVVRYIKGTWPKDWAHFDLRSTYSSHNLDRDLQGIIKMEMPLATRHIANVGYGLKERANVKTGHCVVNYMGRKMLDGQYSCKTESRAGYDKDVVDITIVNDMKPIGISFVHVFEQSGDVDGPQYVSAWLEDFTLSIFFLLFMFPRI